MAIKSNAKSFAASVKIDLDKLGQEALSDVRTIMFETFSDIILRSPVDTGLFRSAHDLTLDFPSAFKPDEVGGPRFSEAEGELQTIRQLKSMKIFITNNLEYAQALEHGHSKQAPNGVYVLAAMRAQEIINRL